MTNTRGICETDDYHPNIRSIKLANSESILQEIHASPEVKFQQLFDNLNEKEEQSLTNRVELDVQYVDAGQYDGNPNTLYITRDIVCGQLLNRSVAVILLHYVRHMPISISSTAAYALGFYRVPTIGVGIQNGEFSTKSVYPTFLRTSPPYSNEARVFLHLLRELQYREVVVVHVNGDVNAMQFIKVFEEDRPNFKIHVRFTDLFPP
ncbi:unnamed protein product [Anisakis simplex]|uniref:ANF_receptor domain-containing protein n=1 Tax=Anisakis simplex TaxID=6269 RepID=A0A0M3J024_ANISI|nr:unnamed protein product [Anisakis simplex]